MKCQAILVIEDDRYIREALVEALQTEGYRVHSVTNGQEGIQTLKRLDAPCLVLLDMMMPTLNGWEFFEIAKSFDFAHSSPVVVLSAVPAPMALQYEREPLPAVGYLQKPITIEKLLETVSLYCDPVDMNAHSRAPVTPQSSALDSSESPRDAAKSPQRDLFNDVCAQAS